LPNEKIEDSAEEKSRGWLVSRRSFLAISGCALAAIAASQLLRKPEASLIQPLLSSQEASHIDEKYVVTSCLNCSGRCAITVRVVNGKAVKIAGNPLSQASEGTVCPRAHIGLQVLYDPERIRTPLKRTNTAKGRRVDPGWVPISWEEGLNEVAGRLHELRNQAEPQKLVAFYGLVSRSSEDMILRFAQAYGTPNVVSDEGGEAERVGRWLADGNYAEFSYELGKANYVLSFGASLLESETPLSTALRHWGRMRREKPNRGKVVVIDPRYSVTAARADEWLPINPGTDAALALGIAHVIIAEGLYDADFIANHCSGFDKFKELVSAGYSPAQAARITGIDAEVIGRIAREFAQTRPAIAWVGRGAFAWQNGAYTSFAIYCLNALVGSLDVPGGVIYPEFPAYREMPAVIEDEIARKGRASPLLAADNSLARPAINQIPEAISSDNPYSVEMAMGFDSNFNMSLPSSANWDEALKEIPFYVHLSPFPSEMAQYADILLPTTTYLEEWGYEHSLTIPTEVRLRQPAVEPQFEAKSIADVVFELAQKTGDSVARSFAGVGDDAEGFVRYRTSNLIDWDELQEKGVWEGADYEYQKHSRIFKTPSGKFEFYSEGYQNLLAEKGVKARPEAFLPHYEAPEYFGENKDYPLTLVTYHPVMDIRNGSQNYPWAQEVYLVEHGRGWNNFVEVNSETAGAYDFKDGDMVWVESPFGKLKVKARVFEGIHPGVVAIALGQGHYAYGRWQKNIGVNPNDILGVAFDRLSGGAASFNTRIRIYRA